LIGDDFIKKDIYEKLGLDLDYKIKNWADDAVIGIWNAKKENFIIKTSYMANFQKGFWEIELLTRFIVLVPQVMVAGK